MNEQEINNQLIEDIASFRHDPLGYVLYAFEWGEGELKEHSGPRQWQREVLQVIGDKLKSGELKGISEAIQYAVASGHGIGKSALVAWIILWSMSTFEDTRGVVTANTDGQLSTKTWPEVSKWYRLAVNKAWFTLTATALFSSQAEHEKTWRFDVVPWSDHKTESFAGLHNAGKRVVLIFDEASAISDKIWEVSEGALTDADTEIIWLAFGNPTRNTGRFRECFGRQRHRWTTKQIDSRTVDGTNKVQIQKWVDDYGEDSDFVRIRVRGLFPRASTMQLIPTDLVGEAMRREARSNLTDPLIMTLDIARGGDDNCVFRFRRGLDARTIPPVRIPGSEVKDSMRLVAKAIELLDFYKPHTFFYDGTGVGGPVGDRIQQLGYSVFEVQFGASSPDAKCANLRAYMYMRCKEWLQAGGAVDNDPILEQDLTSVEYTHDKKDRILLESKEHMKARGLASPDDGDALVMSFAFPVAPISHNGEPAHAKTEYDPYDEKRYA